MPPILLTAAAATVVVLAFSLSPATALPCNDGDAGCVESEQPAPPMKLDDFMKTWKPVAKAKRAKKTKSVRRPAVKEIASEPAVAETAPRPTPMQTIAAKPEQSMETDEVGVTSSNEVEVGVTSSNEVETDGVASQVQVVAFNEVNEVDLATPVAPAPDETFGQSVSAEQPAEDTSWIGKVLLALAGTIALAGATRFLAA